MTIRRATRCMLAAACLISVMAAQGCGGRTIRREGGNEDGYSVSRSIPLDRGEARLQGAQQARMEGRFDEALETFRSIYQDAGSDPELRANALFEIGQTQADLLNPSNDPGQAAETFDRVALEFPDSGVRERAEKRAVELRQRNAPRDAEGSPSVPR